jgi:hypothetical protein
MAKIFLLPQGQGQALAGTFHQTSYGPATYAEDPSRIPPIQLSSTRTEKHTCAWQHKCITVMHATYTVTTTRTQSVYTMNHMTMDISAGWGQMRSVMAQLVLKSGAVRTMAE